MIKLGMLDKDKLQLGDSANSKRYEG